MGLIADVANYGALGDGVHDDTSAIQAAITAVMNYGSGTVVLDPFATYRISTSLTMASASNLTFDGKGATLKPLDSMTVSGATAPTFFVRAASNCSIVNVTFDGNRAHRGFGSDAHSIWLLGCTNVTVSGNRFSNAVCDDVFLWTNNDPTVVTDNCKNCQIIGNFFSDSGRNAISIVHGQRTIVQENYFQNIRYSSPYAGVDVEPNPGDASGITHDNIITENTYVNCGVGVSVGIAANPQRTTISKNTMTGCDRGIDAQGLYQFIVQNTLTGCGIFVENGDASVVEYNTVSNPNNRTGSNGFALYLDTNGVASPIGHTANHNTLSGVVSSQFAGGNTILLSNKIS